VIGPPEGHKALTAQQHLDTGKWRARCKCPDGTFVGPWLDRQADIVTTVRDHWAGRDTGGTTHPDLCNYFWGSHGCDMLAGHEAVTGPIHTCGTRDEDGVCCQYDESAAPEHRVRFLEGEPDEWALWGRYSEGWRQ
jgi:hypothetical protein